MKCYQCSKSMKYIKKGIRFNGYNLDGWKCKCGESYSDSSQTNLILIINKLKDANIKAKLGRNRSNLILRIPKDLEIALKLNEGDKVELKLEKEGFKVIPA